MIDNKDIRIIATPHPLLTDRIDIIAEAGGCLADVLDKSGLKFPAAIDARICVNNLVIPKDQWETFMPQPKDIITLRALPHGGGSGSKNVLRVVMTIAMIAAMGPAGIAMDAAMISGEASFAGVFSAAFLVGGTMLINAMCPPPKAPKVTKDSASQSYGIEGAQNQINLWNPIPVILGRHRFTPPYATKPYTEIAGDDKYLHCVFVAGYAPLQITDLKIGDTNIDDYRAGDSPDDRLAYKIWPNFKPGTDILQYFRDNCTEMVLTQQIKQSVTPILHTTELLTEEISVDISAPYGMVQFDSKGSKIDRAVEFSIQYKLHSAADLPTNWSVGRSGGAIAQRVVGNINRPTAVIVKAGNRNDGFTEQSVTGYTYTIIGIDKTSGALSVYYTHSNLTFLGTSLSSSAAAIKNCPKTPSWVAPICGVLRNSGKTTIDAGDITDLRTSELDRNNTGDFAAIPNGTTSVAISSGTLYYRPVIHGKDTTAIRRTYRFVPPAPGTYDIRVLRVTADNSQLDINGVEEKINDKIYDEIFWTCLRSIKTTDPIVFWNQEAYLKNSLQGGLCLIEMRVKASDQLNGMISNFNCVAHSMLPDWNAAAGVWETRITNNPASLYRAIYQGPANKRPLPDAKLNLTELQAWHAQCITKGFTFNQPVDYKSSVQEIAGNIAAAGRAAPTYKDGKYSIIEDKPRLAIAQHFTPDNSWGFRSSKNLLNLPHGFRVKYADETNNWNATEKMVYADNPTTGTYYDATTASLFEELQLVGITDADLAWVHGRYHLAQLILRPETFSFNADIENLVCTRGDLIRVTHDVPLWGVGTGRIKTRNSNGSTITSVIIDESLTMESGKAYAARFRLANNSSLLANINTVPGETHTLTFTTPVALSSAPAVGDLVMFGEAGNESVELLIKSIQPQSDLTATITALDYSPAVYTADQGTIPPYNTHITLPAGYYAPVILSIRSDESVMIRQANGSLALRMLISLTHPVSRDLHNVNRMEGQYKPVGLDGVVLDSPWISLPQLNKDTTSYSIWDVTQAETYSVRFRYIFTDGTPGPWATLNHTIVGTAGLPTSPTFDHTHSTFTATAANLVIIGITDVDLDFYEIRTDQMWGETINLLYQGKSLTKTIPNPVSGTVFYLKSRDLYGNYSADYDSIAAPTGAVSISNVVADFSFKDCTITWDVTSTQALDHCAVQVFSDTGRANLIYSSPDFKSTAFVFDFILNKLTGGPRRQLYFTITAYDVLGNTGSVNNSAYNAEPAQVELPTVAAILDGLDINWTAIGGDVEHYEVRCDTMSPPAYTQVTYNNQFTRVGLTSAHLYYIQVRATDAFGFGPWSEMASETPNPLAMTDYNMDVPMTQGLVWDTTTVPGTVRWGACKLLFKGVPYDIAAGNTSSQYIYWDLNDVPATFHASNTKPQLDLGKWFMAVFEDGVIYPALQGKIFNGGLIQASTILGEAIGAGEVTADKLSIGNWQGVTDANMELLFHFDNSVRSTSGISPVTGYTGYTLTDYGCYGGGVNVAGGAVSGLRYLYTPQQQGSLYFKVKFNANVNTFTSEHCLVHFDPNLKVYVTAAGVLTLALNSGLVACQINVASWTSGVWHTIQIGWDYGTDSWFLMTDNTGVTSTVNGTWGTSTGYMQFGATTSSTNGANAVLDELRIDKIKRSQSEFLAWYNNNAPHHDPNGMGNKSGTVQIDHNGIRVTAASLIIDGTPYTPAEGSVPTQYFMAQPSIPYNVGDVWYNAGYLYACITANTSYHAGDWINKGAIPAGTILNQGALATLAAVDLATNQVINKNLATLDLDANNAITANTAKLGGIESGANVTGNHTALNTTNLGAFSTANVQTYITTICGGTITTNKIVLNAIEGSSGTLSITGGNISISSAGYISMSAASGLRILSGADINMYAAAGNPSQINWYNSDMTLGFATMEVNYTGSSDFGFGFNPSYGTNIDCHIGTSGRTWRNMSIWCFNDLQIGRTSGGSVYQFIEMTTNSILQYNYNTYGCILNFVNNGTAKNGTTTGRFFYPNPHSDVDLGVSSYAWLNLWYVVAHDVADYYHLDDRDDLALIQQIKPMLNKDGQLVKDKVYDLPYIDDKTLPEILISRETTDQPDELDLQGNVITPGRKKGDFAYAEEGKPYINQSVLKSLILGAIRQLDNNHKDLATKIDDLSKKIK